MTAGVISRAPEAEFVSSATPGTDLVSVIVLVTERPDPLEALYREYAAPFVESGRSFEFIFIAGANYEYVLPPLLELTRAGEPVRAVAVAQTLTEAGLLQCALDHCRGDLVVTLPAYRRIDASGLLTLVQRIEERADVAVARRWPRHDSWINRCQHFAIHSLLRRVVGGDLHDLGCGVRSARKDVLKNLPVYGDFYRFMPLIAWREGYTVEEVAIVQHQADRATRIYGAGIYLRRLIDVLGLYFIVRFREKPLRFFGLIGSLLGSVGIVILAVLALQRISGIPMGDRPLLLGGVLLVVLGVQLFALGLVGEIIVHLNTVGGRRYRTKHAPAP